MELHAAHAPAVPQAVTHHGRARLRAPGDTAYRVVGETRNGKVDTSAARTGGATGADASS